MPPSPKARRRSRRRRSIRPRSATPRPDDARLTSAQTGGQHTDASLGDPMPRAAATSCWKFVRYGRPGATASSTYTWSRTSGQGDPAQFTLKVLGGQRLARLLERAKEQRYYTVPWPVSDYDAE